jgi:hypothetical protein
VVVGGWCVWEMGSSGTLVNAAAWTTQSGVGSSGSAAVVCLEGRSQGPQLTDSARTARSAPTTRAGPIG